MPIRLIDMHLPVQNAPEAARPVIAENLHHSAAQENIAEKFTKESLLNKERVPVVEKPESETINEDGRSNSDHQRDNRKQYRERERREDDDIMKTDVQSKNKFDISI